MKKIEKTNLDELGKIMPIINEMELKYYVGGGDGSSSNPYSYAEADAMMISGTWKGGYIIDMGYVSQSTNVFGGNGSYYTVCEYFSNTKSSGWDAYAEKILRKIGFGGAIEKMERLWIEMGVSALQQGYSCDNLLYVRQRSGVNNGAILELVDCNTGCVIASGALNW